LKSKVGHVHANMNRIVGTAALACAAAVAVAAAPRAAAPPGAVTNHVIVVSIDGLRPDAIEQFPAHTLQRLLREGAWSLTAETVYPSKTLPSHTSMLTGVLPEVHGITWNSDRTDAHGVVQTPTVFELAKQRGFTTAAFFSKAKLRHLQKPGTLDHAQAPTGLEVYMASRTVEDATRYMRFRRPNLLFVHIAEPDAAGHSFGWMGSAYRAAVRRADAAVGQIMATADASYGRGKYTMIITADHGGSGRGHGTDHMDDMQIPWIAWGAGVEPGELAGRIRTMDTAATVLWLLGVAEPPALDGVAVAAAYTLAAQRLAAGVGAGHD
jgi:predicted AlkP superfamily pyrophosphatase or phosphodiesterase